MKHKNKTISFKHTMKYSDEYNEYTIQMVRENRYWWYLLLLLPLLLFVKCKHDIRVTTIDTDNRVPVENVDVTMKYNSHFLFNNGHFWQHVTDTVTQTTDSCGVTVFRDLDCSVFSYIFYCLEQASFTIKSECYTLEPSPFNKNFHYSRNVTLPMVQKKVDMVLHVADKETGEQLAGAVVDIEYINHGETLKASGTTNPAGEVTFKDIPECGLLNMIKGCCHGYVDTTLCNKSVRSIINSVDTATVRMEPLKTRFTFFVKNRLSKEPVPGAICTVTLSHNGNVRSTGTVKTNTDGLGMAAYDDAFVLAKIDIKAVADNYKPGKLEGDYTVEQFVKLPDADRVIWLDPEPLAVDFQLVDSLTGAPISGATIEVTVTDGKGDQVTYPVVTSNSNGKFPVKACKGDKVVIHAERSPMFKPKTHIVRKFNKGEVVKMSPVIINLKFRTLNARNNQLLPECKLSISTSHSKLSKPSTSGSTGEFTLDVYKGETLSITASKSGFGSKAITNANTLGLESASQTSRDLPLKPDPIKYSFSDKVQGNHRECYDLKSSPVQFVFTWSTCTVCTMLTVVDDNGNVIGRFGIDSPSGNGLPTDTRHSAPSGSTVLTSNTQGVCVHIQDINNCNCQYTIEVK